MRCLSCHVLSAQIICSSCEEEILKPTPSRRKVGSLEVVSLFRYSSIEQLLLTKHTPVGFRLYKYFSKQFVRPFLEQFAENIDEPVSLISIDERVKGGYSHTAVLSHYVKHPKLSLSHAVLMAQNSISYAGRSLQYRLDNPRDFIYTGKGDKEVILIDDIITTGVTLQEADQVLQKSGVEVLFALTLADARG